MHHVQFHLAPAISAGASSTAAFAFCAGFPGGEHSPAETSIIQLAATQEATSTLAWPTNVKRKSAGSGSMRSFSDKLVAAGNKELLTSAAVELSHVLVGGYVFIYIDTAVLMRIHIHLPVSKKTPQLELFHYFTEHGSCRPNDEKIFEN